MGFISVHSFLNEQSFRVVQLSIAKIEDCSQKKLTQKQKMAILCIKTDYLQGKPTMSDSKKISEKPTETEEPTVGLGLIVIGIVCLLVGVGTGILISLQ